MILIFVPTPKDNVYPSESLDTTDGNGAHVLTHVNSTGMYPMQMHTLDPPQSVLPRDIRIGTYERRLEAFPASQLRPNRAGGPTRQVELRVNVSCDVYRDVYAIPCASCCTSCHACRHVSRVMYVVMCMS